MTTTFNMVRVQAAIALKAPCSGIPELDDMIRESRRLDMATAAIQGMLIADRQGSFVAFAEDAVEYADALLAASEKESGE